MPIPTEEISPEQLNKLVEEFLNTGATFKSMQGISDETMEAVYSIAYNFYNAQKFDEALKLFTFLCTFDQLTQKYWLGLAGTRQMLKQYESAIEAYSMATMIDSSDPRPPLFAADCYLLLGNRKLAIGALNGAIHFSQGKEEHKAVFERAQKLLTVLTAPGTKAPTEVAS